MKVNISKAYRYAPDGNAVVTVDPGEQELDERWAKKAIASGHGSAVKAKKPAANKSKGNAPEHK